MLCCHLGDNGVEPRVYACIPHALSHSRRKAQCLIYSGIGPAGTLSGRHALRDVHTWLRCCPMLWDIGAWARELPETPRVGSTTYDLRLRNFFAHVQTRRSSSVFRFLSCATSHRRFTIRWMSRLDVRHLKRSPVPSKDSLCVFVRTCSFESGWLSRRIISRIFNPTMNSIQRGHYIGEFALLDFPFFPTRTNILSGSAP
ncbi:hypothetical protein FPV67DRAFT_739858 [Lyophyllum atratum]|nr:hypothetical protein FPV67DRAFT_739858 [Lyophyllum atratum]